MNQRLRWEILHETRRNPRREQLNEQPLAHVVKSIARMQPSVIKGTR